jgi:hypothetical protein
VGSPNLLVVLSLDTSLYIDERAPKKTPHVPLNLPNVPNMGQTGAKTGGQTGSQTGGKTGTQTGTQTGAQTVCEKLPYSPTPLLPCAVFTGARELKSGRVHRDLQEN